MPSGCFLDSAFQRNDDMTPSCKTLISVTFLLCRTHVFIIKETLTALIFYSSVASHHCLNGLTPSCKKTTSLTFLLCRTHVFIIKETLTVLIFYSSVSSRHSAEKRNPMFTSRTVCRLDVSWIPLFSGMTT